MKFKDVIGQQAAKDGFFRFYNSDKVPHALLVNAQEGLGGLPFAIAIAQFILCEHKQSSDVCGTCPSCLKVNKLAHPDLHLSFPSIAPKPGAKASSAHYMQDFRNAIQENPYISTYDWLQYINAENKQGNITAEECRSIVDELQLKSFEGGYKIQIIWRPEYLGKEGNILLKLIEEPPSKTMIILVAEQLSSILNTILSRTQMINLLPNTMQEVANALVTNHQIDHDKALQLALIAQNNYAAAIKLMHASGSNNFGLLKDWFNGVFANKGVLINDWVEQMAKMGREQQKNFILYVQQILGYTMRCTMIVGYQPPLLQEELVFVQKLSARNFSLNIFQNLDQLLTTTIYHIERNAHAKTQFLNTSIKMQYILQDKHLK
mgnify:CR=1 FL=1